jgi:septal ring factor EnvC (AmiA/AmiB activator)
VRRILLACLLLCFAPSPALAESNAQRAQKAAAAQKQLQQTRARIKALAEEQKKIEAERSAASQALREVDGKVSGTQRSLHTLEAQIAEQQKALEDLREKRLALENSLSRQRAELATLIRSAYALGRHEQLKLLLEQDRMSDLARVLAYHRYFQRDRQQRITGISVELQSLAQVGEQIEAKQAELIAARDKQKSELATLAEQRRERGKVVSSLDSKFRDRKARITALGRDEKSTVVLLEKLRKLMAQMPKPVAKPGKPGKSGGSSKPSLKPSGIGSAMIPTGPLKLPLAGSMLAGYGGVMPDGHKSQGWLIAGNPGAEVHAVSAGRVAYADWLKGYGLLIILDHGNGYMTLYAFNDALLKNAGDSVQAGETISTVGSSGGQGRSALYFELRRNGQPQDPRSWLGK